jgi:hypothetical protein
MIAQRRRSALKYCRCVESRERGRPALRRFGAVGRRRIDQEKRQQPRGLLPDVIAM